MQVPPTSPKQNKAIVLEAFDTLFNKRDYVAAERFWSDRYVQHSAHIPPGREGLFNLGVGHDHGHRAVRRGSDRNPIVTWRTRPAPACARIGGKINRT